eukprot:TRINITY_DN995_c0_g3_i3.p1 TRINITY_DN995_c0_g3~~TRINITY_DN995_c0_g3_i3.p1  ORF type:complete len:173 (+),score=56.27 TRINITY_DN995_c0_g3_i3:116-634(+)
MIRRPPRSTLSSSSAASDVYKRQILYGLQRPPLNGQHTVLRADDSTKFDELAPTLLPFYTTNAFETVRISCDPANKQLLAQLGQVKDLADKIEIQSQPDFESAIASQDLYNVVQPNALADNDNTSHLEQFPMVGQFVSLYLPLGHVKSTKVNDVEFLKVFSDSDKWLKMRSV